MQGADTGSVVVTDDGKVVGILTERDLLRAAAGAGDPEHERVRLWMTARPDVLGPDERVDAAWASLTSHHYRHLPVVDGDRCVGVVSLRDLMGVARIRPAAETSGDVPAGLEGVVVAETTDRRRPRPGGLLPLPAVLRRRPGRDALARGRLAPPLPRRAARRGGRGRLRRTRCGGGGRCRRASARCCRRWPRAGHRSTCCAPPCRCSGPSSAGGRRTTSAPTSCTTRRSGCAPSVPTILAAAHRLRQGDEPIEPRDDLGFAANYLYMLTGEVPTRTTPGPSSST